MAYSSGNSEKRSTTAANSARPQEAGVHKATPRPGVCCTKSRRAASGASAFGLRPAVSIKTVSVPAQRRWLFELCCVAGDQAWYPQQFGVRSELFAGANAIGVERQQGDRFATAFGSGGQFCNRRRLAGASRPDE